MKSGDIISYRDMCNAEDAEMLQHGMNYKLHPTHSVLLMSTRPNAPYADEVQENGQVLIYEGHDIPKTADIDNPKTHNQPMYTKNGKLTRNGLFYDAAKRFQNGIQRAETVRVYEKINTGIWVYNGQFSLIDAWQEEVSGRSVFRFKLQALDNEADHEPVSSELQFEHTRVIPSSVKRIVWERDKGKCAKCGNTKNLHFDHILPYSLGGTSLNENNIQILCMSCNLSKRDKIE